MRHPSLYYLFTPVSRIKGVGASMSQTLSRLLPESTRRAGGGLPVIRDLLFHLPVSVVDRRVTFPLTSVPDGVVGTFIVTVDRHEAPANKRFGRKPYRVFCSNSTGTLTLVFFNAKTDYLTSMLPVGAQRVVSGRVEHFDYQLQMTHPDIIAPVAQLADVQKLEPVYPLTAGLTSRRIRHLVDDALEKLPELPEWQAKAPDISFKQALIQLHHPQTDVDLAPDSPARLRLVYDEVLAYQLHLALLRSKMQAQPGVVIHGDGTLTKPLLQALPFTLTQGQQQVIAQIEADMTSGQRMMRLLQGDVGSGKTLVALFAMLKAAEQGLQSALMAPTELIARQHAEVISKLVEGGAWSVEGKKESLATLHPSLFTTLLTGSIKGKEREDALARIESGDAKIIIGTHALFQEKVSFQNLALVVVDEQHRFGVEQRMALAQKGHLPHVLHMTATPIPRSLTMMLYGDVECSLLKEKPADRKPITTRLIPRSRMEEVLIRLQAALDRGEKAYWICPLVEDEQNPAGDADVAAAQSRYTEFTARFGVRVGMVHGRMKVGERSAAMQQFASGKTTLLVATTVVEVGVDVKDATIIVIEQAERFGLAQLHQLRGRVGRGEQESACVLLYSEVERGEWRVASENQSSTLHSSSPTLQRLSILRETDDGFKIAEADLAHRGAGELLGVRQSGQVQTIFVDMFAHHQLIEKARDDAKSLLAADPELASERGQAAQLLLQLFEREVV